MLTSFKDPLLRQGLKDKLHPSLFLLWPKSQPALPAPTQPIRPAGSRVATIEDTSQNIQEDSVNWFH